jgi:hypothetical protein
MASGLGRARRLGRRSSQRIDVEAGIDVEARIRCPDWDFAALGRLKEPVVVGPHENLSEIHLFGETREEASSHIRLNPPDPAFRRCPPF